MARPHQQPTFTGTVALPAVPTVSNDNTAASTTWVNAFVGTKLSSLLDEAPSQLDTLNELAAALNDDANFGSSVVASLDARYTKTEVDAMRTTKGLT